MLKRIKDVLKIFSLDTDYRTHRYLWFTEKQSDNLDLGFGDANSVPVGKHLPKASI